MRNDISKGKDLTSSQKACGCLAMIIWFTLSSFYFYQFIARSSFITVLTNEFMQYFHIDAVGIGFLGSCYYWVYTLMQIPAGIIIDKCSMKKVAAGAAFLCSVGLFVLVATPNKIVAGLGEMLIGFGSSFSFLLVIKAVTLWFPVNRVAIMTSYTMSVGCFGPVVGGPFVAGIVESFNWLSVMRFYSLIGVILSIVIWFVVKDRKVEDEEKKESGEDSLRFWHMLKVMVSSGQLWVLGLLIMAIYAPLSALGDLWGVSFIKTAYGLNSEMAALVNNMIYLGMVIGSPIFAYWATAGGSYKKPMIVGATGALISMAIALYLSDYVNTVALFILFFMMGFCCGSMLEYPLAMALFPKAWGGTVSGFVNTMSMTSGIILMPVIGIIIQNCWNGLVENGIEIYSVSDYRYGLSSVVIFLAAAVVLSFFVKDRHLK